jgi:hypothetical protein
MGQLGRVPEEPRGPRESVDCWSGFLPHQRLGCHRDSAVPCCPRRTVRRSWPLAAGRRAMARRVVSRADRWGQAARGASSAAVRAPRQFRRRRPRPPTPSAGSIGPSNLGSDAPGERRRRIGDLQSCLHSFSTGCTRVQPGRVRALHEWLRGPERSRPAGRRSDDPSPIRASRPAGTPAALAGRLRPCLSQRLRAHCSANDEPFSRGSRRERRSRAQTLEVAEARPDASSIGETRLVIDDAASLPSLAGRGGARARSQRPLLKARSVFHEALCHRNSRLPAASHFD